jgi:hypothetical protein
MTPLQAARKDPILTWMALVAGLVALEKVGPLSPLGGKQARSHPGSAARCDHNQDYRRPHAPSTSFHLLVFVCLFRRSPVA